MVTWVSYSPIFFLYQSFGYGVFDDKKNKINIGRELVNFYTFGSVHGSLIIHLDEAKTKKKKNKT